jgi:hypothetical protein
MSSSADADLRRSISRRIRDVRIDRYGDDDSGVSSLAVALGLPPATWRNYEGEVGMPAEILLKFIGETLANPLWLLTGDGERYSGRERGSTFIGKN